MSVGDVILICGGVVALGFFLGHFMKLGRLIDEMQHYADLYRKAVLAEELSAAHLWDDQVHALNFDFKKHTVFLIAWGVLVFYCFYNVG